MISKLKRIFQSKKKELQEIYNLKNIFIESLIVFFVLALLDGFDIPSKAWEILGCYNLSVIVLFAALYLVWPIRKWWEWSLVGENDYILLSLCIGISVWFIGYFTRHTNVSYFLSAL